MKFKDYVKAGFGVCVGIWLARVADQVIYELLNALTRDTSDKPESEKETKIETEE